MLAASAVVGVRAQQSAGPAALRAEWSERGRSRASEILQVQKNIYMLAGAGGSVTIQVGDEGVAMVDSGSPGMAERFWPRSVRSPGSRFGS